MKNDLDELLLKQQEKLLELNNSTFWSRNKKMIIVIGLILLVLWIFSLAYVFYTVPSLYEMTNQ